MRLQICAHHPFGGHNDEEGSWSSSVSHWKVCIYHKKSRGIFFQQKFYVHLNVKLSYHISDVTNFKALVLNDVKDNNCYNNNIITVLTSSRLLCLM